MASEYTFSNKFFMFRSCFDWWFSFGIHIDFKKRKTGRDKIPYGPYLEIHFLWFILSIGYQPYYGTFNQ
jgi:hypothetical protein